MHYILHILARILAGSHPSFLLPWIPKAACLSTEARFTDLEHAEGLGMPSSETVAKKGFTNVEGPIKAHIVLVILPAISAIYFFEYNR